MLLIMTFGIGGEKCEFAAGEFGQEVRVLQWCKKTNGPLVGLTVGAVSCSSARKAGVESWFWLMAVGNDSVSV